MASNNPKIVFKILIVGDVMVGKSSIVQRYADNKFPNDISPTIGVDYKSVYKEMHGQLTKLMIWDTAGQEKYKSITMSFYHGAHGAILVYDITQKKSLMSLPKWLSELKRICGDIPIVIVGNKWDSISKNRIPQKEIDVFIEELGYADRHFLTSAYTGENVAEAFESLTVILLENLKDFITLEKNKISLRPQADTYSCSC